MIMTVPFIHNLADVHSQQIGAGTRIWQFVVVLPGARVGADCNICSHCLIENDVVIGDRVTIKSGVQLWDGLRVGSDVFIGPNVSFGNDNFPRSRHRPPTFLETFIDHGVSIGSGAVILPGVKIARNAMIGAGAVVTRSVPSNAIVVGNPARIVGYLDAKKSEKATAETVQVTKLSVGACKVEGVKLVKMPLISDIRGSLSVGELTRLLPFTVKRHFLVFEVPSLETRGEHAHKVCHQFLICIKGKCSVVADDGSQREEFELNRPNIGLYFPPMTWGIQYKYSPDAVLLVLASHEYDPCDYIRDYEDFLEAKGLI